MKTGCWTARWQANPIAQPMLSLVVWRRKSNASTSWSTWEDFLADIQPVHIATLDEAGEQARLYSSANSALEQLIRAIANETTLARKPTTPTSGSSYSWLGEKLNRIMEEQRQLARLTGKQVNVGGLLSGANLEADIVDFRFREYRRLAGTSGNGPSPLVSSLQVLTEAAALISSAKQQVKAGGSPPAGLSSTLDKVRVEAKRLPPPLADMYDNIATTTSVQVGQQVRSTIGGNLNAEVGTFCRKALVGRYPFTRGSGKDVMADDFARLFAVGGMMDEFFRSTLQPMVDTSAANWSFKQGIDGTPMGGSASLVAFQRAATIRDVFFRAGGARPTVKVEMKPLDMDASITQMMLDVDGEVLRYQHGPQIPKSLAWPGERGTGQIRLQVTDANGQSTGLVTEGPWAMHRLFDHARIVPSAVPERFTASFTIGGKQLRFQVTTSSVQNPFQLKAMQEFTCPSRL
jgi:type VI secretion system protein ImpL